MNFVSIMFAIAGIGLLAVAALASFGASFTGAKSSPAKWYFVASLGCFGMALIL